ncbi:MAG: peptide ABC transporter substrate-binding protein [Bdellovibrionaceae bacterium]|nr:peptide ABC transporter substrate-binding protein [Bdellovibrio sp.]
MKIKCCLLISLLLSLNVRAEEIPLRIAVIQEFTHLNPITMNLASTEAFMHFVMREMSMGDGTGKIIPDLAEKLPSFENKLATEITDKGTKKIKATWQIKKAAAWSDGTPVTCQDWWMGWQAGLSQNTSVLDKGMYTKIEKLEWTSAEPKKCVVTYANNNWTFDRDLPFPIPYHIENEIFSKWKSQKEAYDQNTGFVVSPTRAGLYDGPYQVQEFKLGSHFILIPNPYFYGDKPQIAKIAVKHIGESNAILAHLQTGAINMVSAVGFPPDLALSYAENEAKQPYKVFFQDSPVFQGLFINHENEILSDVRVRKALSLAIDKKKLTEAFFNSKLRPAETFLPPTSAEFKNRPAVYDVKKARQLLDEAGWKVNDKNVRIKNGKTLTIDFKTSAGIKVLETIQIFICDEFSKIQVQCSIKNQPPRILLGDTISHGDYALAMFGNSILPNISLSPIFSSKEIPRKENSWAGGNSLRWRSATMDQLLLQFDKERNSNKRAIILAKMETEVIEQTALIPIYHRKEAAVLPDELTGMEFFVKGTDFAFPEKWRLK